MNMSVRSAKDCLQMHPHKCHLPLEHRLRRSFEYEKKKENKDRDKDKPKRSRSRTREAERERERERIPALS
jgi:hypothetical protein